MASCILCVLAGVSLIYLLTTPCYTQIINPPKYTTVEKCNEVCPKHPAAVCKLDCLIIAADGTGKDCINHFYDDNGVLVDCWE